jgi:hypothetical protein
VSPKLSLSLRFLHQNPVYTSPPYALHSPPISLLSILLPENYWVSSTDQYSCHYVVSSLPVTLSLLGPNILLSTFFSDTPILHFSFNVKKLYYCSVYLKLYILWYQTGRQKILHWMIARIFWLQSALNFFLNIILIC